MKEAISIKGTREGLTITFGSGDLPPIIEDLQRHLQAQGAFFRGGRVALQLGQRDMPQQELEHLNDLLAGYDMILRTVVCSSQTTQQAAASMGLRVIEPRPRVDIEPEPTAAPPILQTARGLGKGVLLRHLVRSGQVVRHTGHVAVLGDVNAGGEVVAGGDIIVWGRLYGTAHAGSMGNQDAVICALEMAPLQLRIGNLVARPEENERYGALVPEMASIRDDAIVVEPWNKPLRGVY